MSWHYCKLIVISMLSEKISKQLKIYRALNKAFE